MKKILFIGVVISILSCTSEKVKTDLLVKNATIYTVNEGFDIAEAFIVNNGKIVEVGSQKNLEAKYEAANLFDANGKTIVPGLIDAHAHLLNLGISMQQVDLVGTKSYQEVLKRVITFQEENNSDYIIGRGWDQNDWEIKEFPTKEELDFIFPNTPVSLRRIDGHAMIVNSKAIEMAGITKDTKMAGGEVYLKDGEPSGILIDSPMELVWNTYPKEDKAYYIKALKDAEK
ncbi:MAG: putative amidohydrolase YtcJ, partial [Flavobacteriaceae bacterium]